MLNEKHICKQLSLMYPDFGECGNKLCVNWDGDNQAWAVDFEYKGNKIRHFLENEDATTCIIENRCIGIGIDFGQFR